jgi:hypothetical protein
LPAEGDDAGTNHSFNYVARFIGPSDEEEVSISLVTRAKDGALGCAEAACKINGECMWFGIATTHRGEGAAYRHAMAKHGSSQPAAKKKPKQVALLKGQQTLMFRQPLPPPVVGTPVVGMPAVPPAVPVFASNYGFRVISREEGEESTRAEMERRLDDLRRKPRRPRSTTTINEVPTTTSPPPARPHQEGRRLHQGGRRARLPSHRPREPKRRSTTGRGPPPKYSTPTRERRIIIII